MWTPTVWYGGAKGVAIGTDYAIVDRRIRVWSFDPSVNNLIVSVPDARKLWVGGGAPVFVIVNEDLSHTIVLKDAAGNTLVSILAREAAMLYLRDKSTLAGTWVVNKSAVN